MGICVESRLGFGAALTKSPRPRCLFALGGIAVWSPPNFEVHLRIREADNNLLLLLASSADLSHR